MRRKYIMSPSCRRYLIKIGHIRRFNAKHSLKAVDSSNGRSLDNSQEVANAYHNDRAGLEEYSDKKRESIIADHRTDSITGAADGVPASELASWMEERDRLLEEFDWQLEDIKDLADIPLGSESPDATSQIPSEEAEAPSQNTSEEAEAPSQNTSFPQDSSDVQQTDFNSFEPFGEE